MGWVVLSILVIYPAIYTAIYLLCKGVGEMVVRKSFHLLNGRVGWGGWLGVGEMWEVHIRDPVPFTYTSIYTGGVG